MRAFSSATRSEECKYSQLRFCTRVCKNSVSGNNISPKASTRSVKAICNDYVGEDNSFITSPRIVSSSDMVVSLLARFIEMLLDLSANFSMSLLFLLLRWSITFSSWQETYKFATITTTSPPSLYAQLCTLGGVLFVNIREAVKWEFYGIRNDSKYRSKISQLTKVTLSIL